MTQPRDVKPSLCNPWVQSSTIHSTPRVHVIWPSQMRIDEQVIPLWLRETEGAFPFFTFFRFWKLLSPECSRYPGCDTGFEARDSEANVSVLQQWPSCAPELALVGSVTWNFLSHEEMGQSYHFSFKGSGILLLAVESIVAVDPMLNTDDLFS